MATALVAGATGYTGQAVVAELVRQGATAHAHVRPDSPRLEHWRAHFTAQGAIVDTTAWDSEQMARTLGRLRPTLLFALLGTTQARGRAARRAGTAAESYQTVDYGLTALLIDAAVATAPELRFVYLSAHGVGPGSRTGYYRARWQVEEKLRQSGLAHVVARPAMISGSDREEGRPAERVAALLSDGLLRGVDAVARTRLRRRVGSLSSGELARALVRCALDEDGAALLTVEDLHRAALA